MDLGIITTIIVGAICIIVTILFAKRDNWARLRKMWYRLRNREFKIEINGKKKYREFKPNISKLRAQIEQYFKKRGQRIEISDGGFLQIQVSNMQAPYRIMFTSEVGDPSLILKRVARESRLFI
jgi:N12 class adenine-specific DNA methylase